MPPPIFSSPLAATLVIWSVIVAVVPGATSKTPAIPCPFGVPSTHWWVAKIMSAVVWSVPPPSR